jgi:hypothetical protein
MQELETWGWMVYQESPSTWCWYAKWGEKMVEGKSESRSDAILDARLGFLRLEYESINQNMNMELQNLIAANSTKVSERSLV